MPPKAVIKLILIVMAANDPKETFAKCRQFPLRAATVTEFDFDEDKHQENPDWLHSGGKSYSINNALGAIPRRNFCGELKNTVRGSR